MATSYPQTVPLQGQSLCSYVEKTLRYSTWHMRLDTRALLLRNNGGGALKVKVSSRMCQLLYTYGIKTVVNVVIENTKIRARAGRLLCVTAVVFFKLWADTVALEAKINKLVYNYNGIKGYSFEFETSDGTYRREDGGLVSNLEDEGLVVRGEYGYTDPDGRRHTVRYIADRNGYQPQYDDQHTRFNDRRIV